MSDFPVRHDKCGKTAYFLRFEKKPLMGERNLGAHVVMKDGSQPGRLPAKCPVCGEEYCRSPGVFFAGPGDFQIRTTAEGFEQY